MPLPFEKIIEKCVSLTKDNDVMEVIETVPKTALDVFRILPEGTLCEVIDNILYMSPAPKFTHQRLLGFLHRTIGNHVAAKNLGETVASPCDVYLEHLLSAVQPDMLFVSNENMDILKEDDCIHGAPDLVVEVLSGDKKRDKVKKKSLYERAGVKEYFIVDPKSRRVQCYVLNENKYEMAYDEEGIFKSELLGLAFHF